MKIAKHEGGICSQSRDQRNIIVEIISKWPSGIVSRSEIGTFSGGVLHPRTMANRDSNGTGIKPVFKCGRKVFYRTIDAAEYLLNQIIK